MPSPSEIDRGPAPDGVGRPLTRIVRAAPAMLRPHIDLPEDAAAAYDASTDIPGAFWSGDSISPLGQPPVAPPPHLTGLAVAGAVVLASVRSRPEKQHERLAAFLSSACHIAGGGHGRLEPEAG
jgi:hypothetical protein